MGSILFKAIMGMVAGVLVWAFIEPMRPHTTDFYSQDWMSFESKLYMGWAIALGASVGFLSGYQRGSKVHALKEGGLSILFAIIGSWVGMGLAGAVLSMFPLVTAAASASGKAGVIAGGAKEIVRIVSLTCFGIGMGAGIGFSTFVPRRGLQGAIGGLIGGAIGGILFNPISTLTSGIMLQLQHTAANQTAEVGTFGRGLFAAILCGAIALMIGIIEALFRSAWVRLELGRNEGKEWAIDKSVMSIGRFERADIPLFGDQNVAQQHAYIQKEGDGYFIVDQGTPMGVVVNGQRIQKQRLSGGDVIQIGQFNLRFLLRNSKVPNRGPEPLRGAAAYPAGAVPMQPGPGMAPMQPTMMGGMPMQPTMMGGMPMQPTVMGGQMQPTMMNPANQMMQQTMVVPSQSAMQPTVAVPAQPNLQPTMAVQTGTVSLVAMDGPLMGQRFPLNMPIDLGRECVQVPMSFDTSASRKHARVEPAGMFVNVSDLGSTNGTFVNGQRVSNATAKSGDIVKVGATSFRIES